MKTKTSFKRMLSILLCCAMLLGLMPITVSAESYSGSCGAQGDNVTWSLDTEIGVLKITGAGKVADYGYSSSPWYAYRESIKSVEIDDGVTSIGDCAFCHCDSLTNVTIPDSVTEIGYFAFANSSSMTSVTIPDNVTSIGEYAFCNCSGLTSITIPNGVTCIDTDTFYGCVSLTSVMIPNNVTSIGEEAFRGCSALTSITIPDSVTFIGENAFYDCTSLTSLTIPDSEISIGGSAFGGCSSLTSVTIPGSVTSIGEYAFCDCSGLASITIQDGVTSIGRFAFSDCISLKSIAIPEGVTNIGARAFYNCPNVTIYGVEGSYAQTYANENDIPFRILTNTTVPDDNFISTVYFLEGWNSDSRCLTFAHNGPTEPEFYTLADNVDATNIEQFLNKYVLVTYEKGEELFTYTVTAIQPLDSKIGTVTAAGERSLTIDGTEYPVREDWILMANVGDEILYHISNGTIMGYSALEEKHGILEGWDNTTKRVTIDGVEYPTNYLTDLSFLANLDEYLRKGVYFTTSGSADYCPLLKITDFYYPGGKLEDFDADIYHATWIAKGGNAANILQNDTPSKILVENVEKHNGDTAIDLWRSFKLVFDTLDDVSTLYDFAVEPRDIYSAQILNALKASVSYDIIASEYEDGLKLARQLVSDVNSTIKASHGVDLADDLIFQRMTTDNSEEIEEYISDWFKEKQPDLADMGKSFKWISKGLKTVGGLEDFAEYCASCYALSQVSETMKTVLQRTYEKSVAVYGPLDNMSLAFQDCVEVVNTGVDDMWQRIGMEGVTVVGEGFAKYLVKEVLWSHITTAVGAKCPEVAILQVGYNVGKTISNWLCDTDDSVEQYLKMDYITDIESLVDGVYNDLRIDFHQNPTKELAQAYLGVMELSFCLRDVDCEIAYKYTDILGEDLLHKIFGNQSYEDLKESINSYRNEYASSYVEAQTGWVLHLEEDYPGSGLYEKYAHLIDPSNLSKLKKEFHAACPINVYVYDQSNNVVASVVDNRVSCQADDLMIALLGDEKVIRFYDNADYRVEYTGYDDGDMDVTISEFDESENTMRTVNYYNVPLTNQTTYALASESETMKPYTLEKTSDGTVVEHDYDSMDTTTSHTVKVVSGTLEQNGEIFSETTAQKGEALVISAYVPEGYQFIRWETDAGDAVLRDGNAESTVLIMGDTDIVVTAVMSIPQAIPQAAPAAPELESKTYSSITLKAISPNANGAAAEYSKNDGATWQTSPTFTDLTASTEYSFVARYAETENYKASPASAALKVTTDALPHVHNLTLVPGQAATCTDAGWKDYYSCTCGKHFEDNQGVAEIADLNIWNTGDGAIPALGHDWNEWETTEKPTCATEGSKTRTCKRDSQHTETETVPSLGHKNTEVRDVKAATEDEEGYTGDTWCKDCNTKISSGTVIPKLDHIHAMVKTEAKVATHNADGNIEYYTCSKCGKIYNDEAGTRELTAAELVIKKIEHSYSTDWKSDKDNHWHECSCGNKIDVAAHDVELKNAKEATETEKGYTGDKVCKICGYTVEKGKEIPTLAAPANPGAPDNPNTGDNMTMFIWIALMSVSGVGVVCTTAIYKKKGNRS